jgi:hypothetical protein
MPTADTFHTPLQQSPAQPPPGQRGDAARKRSGKFRAQPATYPAGFFSEPTRAWPAMRFESRLCNPHDPLYVGRAPDQGHKPHPRPQPKPDTKFIPPECCRVRAGTQAWELWCLLVKRGTQMTGGEIAMRLGWRSTTVSGIAKRMVQARAIVMTKRSGSYSAYSIGPTPVAEV